jgi:PAS domain S-box-containing protein
MHKKEYIESNILKLLHSWTNIATGVGSLVIVSLCFLDYFVTPENFRDFLFYRIIAAVAIFGTYLFNKQKIDRNRHHIITITASVIVSTMVSLMIAKFGGHQSPYFAGMILTVIFVVGLAPLNVTMCIIASAVIYGIYLLPILSYDTIVDTSFFLNANIFILSSIFGIILLRYLIHQRFVSEFGLQYDIEQQKKQLENYSQKLEDLVQERTKELTISEKWHRFIFDNATDGIMVLDRNGNIINVNKKACEIHGFDRDALLGVNIEILEVRGNKEASAERLSRILNGESLIYEAPHYKKNGDKVLLEVSANRIEIDGKLYIQSFYRDITEKKRIQDQLMHSQKMDSVGVLAGGIAHNFNNILTAILGNAELLLEYSDLADTAKKRVQSIEVSSRKAGVMVSKLLSFARKDSHEILPLNLHDLIQDSLKLFEGVLDKRIGIKVKFCQNNPTIEGDPNQIEQVIMNLMVNARDAMPSGGLISIITNVVEFSEDAPSIPSYIAPGRYVMLAVSDTGTGIPPDIVNRIFDPFFTTKEKGKGTGLGLATVYGIVKDHQGYISVQSEKDNGTTFHIYLPLSGKMVQHVTRAQPFTVEGEENILLVDDDKDVLTMMKDLLEKHGYNVITSHSAIMALDIFRESADSIHMVITDMVMPLMEGQPFIEEIRKLKPGIKIIAISGYSDEKIKKENFDLFLKKPFETMQLLTAVRNLLDIGSKKLPLY